MNTNIIFLSLTLFLTSCGGDWYLETGPKQATYLEEPKEGNLAGALSTSERQIVFAGEDPEVFETKGTGFNIGVTYKSQLIQQKFQYYQNSFDTVSYSYSVNGSPIIKADIDYETTGYSYLLGMRIGNFIPRVALRSENQKTTTTTDEPRTEVVEKDGQIFVGYGIEFHLPVTASLDVFASWDRTLKVSKDPNFRIRNDEIAIGFNYNPFAKSGTSTRPNESILPYWRLY